MSLSASPYLSASGHNPSSGEESLWVAVVAQAITDACWSDPDPDGAPGEWVMFMSHKVRRRKANRLRDEAAFWLTMDNSDFRQVCNYAGLDHGRVRRWAQRAMHASDDEKAEWAANRLSLRDLQPAGELRAECERQEGRRDLVLP